MGINLNRRANIDIPRYSLYGSVSKKNKPGWFNGLALMGIPLVFTYGSVSKKKKKKINRGGLTD